MALKLMEGIALITGAAAGIGEETGYAFAEAGALGVVFADLDHEGTAANAEKSKEFATHTNYKALAVKVDITSSQSVQDMADFVIKEFGRVDYSVNSAGIDIDNFDMTLSVNARGTALCIRAISKVMIAQEPRSYKGRHGRERSLGRGTIVNLASALSYAAGPGMMAYIASKHAIIGITKVAALNNAKHGIRVNALCPSWVDTPMLGKSLKRWRGLEKVIQSASPAGRPATSEEVANVVVFMSSPSTSYISGTGLLIDAGMLVTSHI